MWQPTSLTRRELLARAVGGVALLTPVGWLAPRRAAGHSVQSAPPPRSLLPRSRCIGEHAAALPLRESWRGSPGWDDRRTDAPASGSNLVHQSRAAHPWDAKGSPGGRGWLQLSAPRRTRWPLWQVLRRSQRSRPDMASSERGLDLACTHLGLQESVNN